MKGCVCAMAYTKEQRNNDIIENFEVYADYSIEFKKDVDGKDCLILTDDKTGLQAGFSEENLIYLATEDYCDTVVKNMGKVSKDINSLYARNNAKVEPIMTARIDEPIRLDDLTSMKLNLNGSHTFSYDLLSEDFKPLPDRIKETLTREILTENINIEKEPVRIKSVGDDGKPLTPEQEAKEIENVLGKIEPFNKNDIEEQKEAAEFLYPTKENSGFDVNKNELDVTQFLTTAYADTDFDMVAEKFNHKKQGFSDLPEISPDIKVFSNTDRDVFVLANADASASKYGLHGIGDKIQSQFEKDYTQYAILSNKQNKTDEDLQVLASNKFAKAINEKDPAMSTFEKYVADYVKDNIDIRKINDVDAVKFTDIHRSIAVAKVDFYDYSLDEVVNSVNKYSKLFPDVDDKVIIMENEDGTQFEYKSAKTVKTGKDDLYRNTDTISFIDKNDDTFATMYITRSGNPTMTVNTNNNELLKEHFFDLKTLRNAIFKDMQGQSLDFPDDVTINEVGKEIFITDKEAQMVHYIDSDTMNKSHISYKNKNNAPAQEYVDSQFYSITSLEDYGKLARMTTGVNAVEIKPFEINDSVASIPVFKEIVGKDLKEHALQDKPDLKKSKMTVNVVLDDKDNYNSRLRLRDGISVNANLLPDYKEEISSVEYSTQGLRREMKKELQYEKAKDSKDEADK